MGTIPTRDHAAAAARLEELVEKTDKYTQPFLYYLPQLVSRPEQTPIDPANAVRFTEAALKHGSSPIIIDALIVLNRIIDPEDGHLNTPSRTIFYENRHFFWDELGGHTRATDVISHVFHRAMFFLEVGGQ